MELEILVKFGAFIAAIYLGILGILIWLTIF